MIWERGGEWWEWNDKRYLEWDIENKTSKKPRLLVELWKTNIIKIINAVNMANLVGNYQDTVNKTE